MKIHRSILSATIEFRAFWNAALSRQKTVGSQLWPPYPAEKIEAEIQSGLHFSVFLPGDQMAGYFSLTLSDKTIWEEKERGDAIYIHRMCANPACKGTNLASSILAWAYGYAAGAGRKFIRMDTWGDNPRLVNYYIACGFRHIGNRQLGLVPDLLPHYNNLNLALFENPLENRSGASLL